jgi:hypothetical protein
MAKKTRETTEVARPASPSSSSASEEVVSKKSRRTKETAAPAAAAAPRAPKVKKPVYVPSVDESGHIVVSELSEAASPDDLFKALRGWVTHMREFVRSVSAIADQCETAHRRLLRESTRKSRKRQVDPSKPKKLGTFTKLMEVPDNVCKFMGLPKGSYVSRVDVTTAVTNYINKHGLRVTEEGPHKGEIRRDDKLNLVLAPRAYKKSVNGEVGEEYKTILSKNLQAWLSHNYKKPAPDDCQPTVEQVEEKSRARKAERAAEKAAAPAPAAKKTAAAPAAVPETKEKKKRTKKNPEVAED